MPEPQAPEPKAPESEEPAKSAERLAAQLAQAGHPEHAGGLRRALALGAERAVLFALDETCQTLLSMVEGFDPETEGMIEQFRLSLDRRLKGSGPRLKPPAPP